MDNSIRLIFTKIIDIYLLKNSTPYSLDLDAKIPSHINMPYSLVQETFKTSIDDKIELIKEKHRRMGNNKGVILFFFKSLNCKWWTNFKGKTQEYQDPQNTMLMYRTFPKLSAFQNIVCVFSYQFRQLARFTDRYRRRDKRFTKDSRFAAANNHRTDGSSGGLLLQRGQTKLLWYSCTYTVQIGHKVDFFKELC